MDNNIGAMIADAEVTGRLVADAMREDGLLPKVVVDARLSDAAPADKESNMLILSRKLNEIIRVGDATVQIIALHRNRVVLGIDAPAYVDIRRDELPASTTDEIPRAALHPEHRRPLEKAEYAAINQKKGE